MIRKLILIFIALSFFSVCFAGSIQDMHKAAIARKNVAVGTTVFDENFDNCDTGTGFGNCDETWGTDADWTVTASAGTDSSNAAVYDGGTGQIYSLSNGFGAGDFEITFDVLVYSGTTDLDDYRYRMLDTSNNDGPAIYMRWRSDSTFDVYTWGHTEGAVSVVGNLSLDTWYTITINNISWASHTFDIDVAIKDGASQGNASGREFLNASTANFDDIYITGATANAMEGRIDNIKVVEY